MQQLPPGFRLTVSHWQGYRKRYFSGYPPASKGIHRIRVLNREAGRNLECGSLLPLWIEKSPDQEIIVTLAGSAIVYLVTAHWHHSPVHLFVPGSIYMVTAGTLYKEHFFAGDRRLKLLQGLVLETVQKHGWTIQAWAVFVNHYHLMASAPGREFSLELLIKELHSKTAREVNQLDEIAGRQVWYQYWDTCLKLKFLMSSNPKRQQAAALQIG